MIHCLSCKKYPYDTKVIPFGSTFPIDTYLVYLLAKDAPTSLDLDGSDVEELPDGCKFAVGSRLYVVNGTSGSEVYIYNSNEFSLYTSSIMPDATSDVVGIGLVDYMILTQ